MKHDTPGRPSSAAHDPLITLADVPRLKWLPRRRGKSRLAFSTVYRWAMYGQRGVKLRTVRAGGTLCTTEAWVRDYFERLADPNPAADRPTKAEISRQHEAAERELAAAGI